MLDLGFPPGARSEQDNGATALHLSAAAGSIGTVRLLLERGADIEARDTAWNSTPLEWAIVGSGMRLGHDPDPDWPVDHQRAPRRRRLHRRDRAVPRRSQTAQPRGRRPAARPRNPRRGGRQHDRRLAGRAHRRRQATRYRLPQ